MDSLPNCYRCGKQPCKCKDGITLYHADCRDVLPLLAGTIDYLLSDPPYGIGYVHGGRMRGVKAAVRQTLAASRRGCVPVTGDNTPFDPSHLLMFPKILLWGADNYRDKLPSGGTFLAWDKTLDRGPADFFLDCEFAWCNWREPRNVFSMLWKGLACDKRGENNGLRQHPTQKPLRLMRWCLEKVPDTKCACDPYAGSGTTGRACKDLGRKCIMVEIEERYCKIAANRLRQEVLF